MPDVLTHDENRAGRMLDNPLGSAAEEHALVTGVSVCRDNDEIRVEISSNRANLLIRCAGARLERGDIAVGAILQGKSLQPFHESPV